MKRHEWMFAPAGFLIIGLMAVLDISEGEITKTNNEAEETLSYLGAERDLQKIIKSVDHWNNLIATSTGSINSNDLDEKMDRLHNDYDRVIVKIEKQLDSIERQVRELRKASGISDSEVRQQLELDSVRMGMKSVNRR